MQLSSIPHVSKRQTDSDRKPDTVQADVDFEANICDDSTILCARAGVEPRFNFTVEGGAQADIAVRVSACNIWVGRIGSKCVYNHFYLRRIM